MVATSFPATAITAFDERVAVMLSRRGFDALAIGAALGLAAGDTAAQPVGPQIAMVRPRTETLEIACEALGPEGGPAVILLHGFPDDPRAWDGVAPPLAEAGCRVYVPFLRGYGPTRFSPPRRRARASRRRLVTTCSR